MNIHEGVLFIHRIKPLTGNYKQFLYIVISTHGAHLRSSVSKLKDSRRQVLPIMTSMPRKQWYLFSASQQDLTKAAAVIICRVKNLLFQNSTKVRFITVGG